MATVYVQILMSPSSKVWYSCNVVIHDFVRKPACVTSRYFADKAAPPNTADIKNDERDMAMETFILAFLTAKV